MLESSPSAADSVSVMLNAHYELHSNRGSSSNEAILALPPSVDVENDPSAVSQVLGTPGRALVSGVRSGPEQP